MTTVELSEKQGADLLELPHQGVDTLQEHVD